MEKPFTTELRVDSVQHSPIPKNGSESPRLTTGTMKQMCVPLYDLISKPQSVEIDLKRMT